jgi:hypothetical protein
MKNHVWLHFMVILAHVKSQILVKSGQGFRVLELIVQLGLQIIGTSIATSNVIGYHRKYIRSWRAK